MRSHTHTIRCLLGVSSLCVFPSRSFRIRQTQADTTSTSEYKLAIPVNRKITTCPFYSSFTGRMTLVSNLLRKWMGFWTPWVCVWKKLWCKHLEFSVLTATHMTHTSAVNCCKRQMWSGQMWTHQCRTETEWNTSGSTLPHSYWSWETHRNTNWSPEDRRETAASLLTHRGCGPDQGQWWSILRIHLWQTRQWCALGGR